MKKLIVTLLFILCGCGQDAKVLSVDGTHVSKTCISGSWVKCINEMCPKGYDIVEQPADPSSTGIIRCKPFDPCEGVDNGPCKR